MPKSANDQPLLNILAEQNREVPLAEKLRPRTLEDYLGQNQIVGNGTPLHNLIESKQLTNLVFWGPPGVGKTTLARIIANNTDARFIELSATNIGIKELREAIDGAKEALKYDNRNTVVFIDEIHRYSKTQQDAILPHVENGSITLMGATTENPSFQVNSALRSRVLIVKLEYLNRDQMKTLIIKGVKHLGHVIADEEAVGFIADYANGDGRASLNLLELASKCAPWQNDAQASGSDKKRLITVELLEQLAQQNRLNYDRQGDEHYDHASAYQKSIRGGDADAAIYWLAKMIAAGEDPRFIARRLVVTASEDIGLATPTALVVANAAAEAVERIGLPEGRIPLAHATIYLANAKKSNAAICAVDKALGDILHNGKNYPIPKHLRDDHYSDAADYGHGEGYIYTHSNPNTDQQFLPGELVGTRYVDFPSST